MAERAVKIAEEKRAIAETEKQRAEIAFKRALQAAEEARKVKRNK